MTRDVDYAKCFEHEKEYGEKEYGALRKETEKPKTKTILLPCGGGWERAQKGKKLFL
jgi:hypothetical protein